MLISNCIFKICFNWCLIIIWFSHIIRYKCRLNNQNALLITQNCKGSIICKSCSKLISKDEIGSIYGAPVFNNTARENSCLCWYNRVSVVKSDLILRKGMSYFSSRVILFMTSLEIYKKWSKLMIIYIQDLL